MSEKLKRHEVREGAFLELYQMMFGQTLEDIDELNAEAFDMAKNEQTDENAQTDEESVEEKALEDAEKESEQIAEDTQSVD